MRNGKPFYQYNPIVFYTLAVLVVGVIWYILTPTGDLPNFNRPGTMYPLILMVVAEISFAASWFVTPRLRDLAIRKNWFDLPEARRVHENPTPRIGGLGMFVGFFFAVLFGLLAGLVVPELWVPGDIWRICLLLVGAALVTVVMLVDDLRGLPPLPRLFAQIVAAAIVIVPQLIAGTDDLADNGHPIGILIHSIATWKFADVFGSPLWLLVAVPFTFFWIVGMINTVNATDGIDGLAGGVVFIGAVILFLETLIQNWTRPTIASAGGTPQFQFTSSLLALALAAAILGFLIFNWHPASIFMGDCGSNFLGFALAVISIIDGAKVAVALLIIGFPVLDLAFVYLNRIYHGRDPKQADRSHIHHRLIDMGWKQQWIVALFYGISIFFGVVGILPFNINSLTKFISLGVLMLCLIPLLYYSVRFRKPQPPASGPANTALPPEEVSQHK
jgi:UDP-N-acetylmuramyl pentapeptide phosphotransferase/UDP-N-acetylglucosamine-1-phosphate transferase